VTKWQNEMIEIIIFYKNDRAVSHEYFFGEKHYRDLSLLISSAKALAKYRLAGGVAWEYMGCPDKAIVYGFDDVLVKWPGRDPAWCFYVTCMGERNPYYLDNDKIVRTGLDGIVVRTLVTL
jgi:hypothetical protein